MPSDANLSCWRCGGEFSHVRTDGGERFECDGCGQELAQVSRLEELANGDGLTAQLAETILDMSAEMK